VNTPKSGINEAVVGIGSNIRPRRHFRRVRRLIKKNFHVAAESRPIKTKPVGFEDQPDFLNGAVRIRTEWDRDALIRWMKQTEHKLGRVRTENPFGPRTMDLDLLVWNGMVMDRDVFDREFLYVLVKNVWPNLPEK